MWDIPKYRIRAHVRGLRYAKSRSSPKPVFHMKRTTAEIAVIDGFASPRDIVRASVVLNDLTTKGIYLFTEHPLNEGQIIALTFQDPRSFYVKGRVQFCKMLSLKHSVYSDIHYPYRALIVFELDSELERMEVKEFCSEIYYEHLFWS